MTPRWPLTPYPLRSHVQLYPRIIVSHSHGNTSKCVDTVILFFKLKTKRSMTPRWPLTPLLLRSHVWLYPSITVSKSHANTSTYVETATKKTLTKRSMTPNDPRWPLTSYTLRSHGQLCPRIIVSNSHKNTSKHVDTVTFFSKTLTKGQWPLDDLWPHFCWGHMCASTQG